jgi:hypothetical protein
MHVNESHYDASQNYIPPSLPSAHQRVGDWSNTPLYNQQQSTPGYEHNHPPQPPISPDAKSVIRELCLDFSLY